MAIVYGLDNYPRDSRECVVGVGVFDGVHLGHRAIFGSVVEKSLATGADSVALTFDRHPVELFAPHKAPLNIMTLEQRVHCLESIGVDTVVVAEFNQTLANLPKEDFLQRVIIGVMHGSHIVVGANFRFGRNREGDIRYLTGVAPGMGLAVEVVSSVIIGGTPVSSTRIRKLIANGDVEEAGGLLDQEFTLAGRVVPGRQIGRTMGFPTANVQFETRQILPAAGVYNVGVELAEREYNGVCNIGTNPTFDAKETTVEVHILDFEGDIYGELIELVFRRRIRDELRFSGKEELANQIREDLRTVRSTGNVG